MSGIYFYKNKINNKKYVGQAIDLERRKKDHKVRAFNQFDGNTEYNTPLHKAFRKYGYEAFTYIVLEQCSIDMLNDRETYWIQHYNTYKCGYNQTNGGTERHFCKLNRQILDAIEQDLINTSMTFDEIRKKYNVSIGFVSELNSGKVWQRESINYPLRSPIKTVVPTCCHCGKLLSTRSKAKKCHACATFANRLVDRPTRNELKTLIRENSFVSIGEAYGVTDNAIKKWCKQYHLPYKKKEIITITDDEWDRI